jgi:hypothetical protein
MKKNGFIGCEADKCIFIKDDERNISAIAIYVDDLSCGSLVEVRSIIAFLKKSFSIKELGDVQYCLSVKIERDSRKKQMFLSQKEYIEQLVERFGLSECNVILQPALILWESPK